jgi:hypothetical protein
LMSARVSDRAFLIAATLFTAAFVAFFQFPYIWTVETSVKPHSLS